MNSLNLKDTGLVEIFPHPILQSIKQYVKERGLLGGGASSTEVQPAKKAQSAGAPEKVMFVTWIAFGAAGDGGFKTHNFHHVDMRCV